MDREVATVSVMKRETDAREREKGPIVLLLNGGLCK
jgi:hypothetical protein